MRIKRFIYCCLCLFFVALVWNGLLHGLLLVEHNASVESLRRGDFKDLMWLSFVMTFGVVTLFTYGYVRFARSGTVGEGLLYGCYFALVAGLLVDLNQYILYPLPSKLVLLWFLGGLCEFTLYGYLLSKMYPVKNNITG